MKKLLLLILMMSFYLGGINANAKVLINEGPNCKEIAIKTFDLWYGETGAFGISMNETEISYNDCVNLGGTPAPGGWGEVVHEIASHH